MLARLARCDGTEASAGAPRGIPAAIPPFYSYAEGDVNRGFPPLPLGRITLWALLLNMGWEFIQCIFLYDMWDWGFWKATAWMWGAILGDVVIVLGVTLLSTFLVGAERLRPPNPTGWAALVGVGFVAGVALEWLARVLRLWEYSGWMPILEVGAYEVGLSPIAQITVLPAVSVYLASRGRLRAEAGSGDAA